MYKVEWGLSIGDKNSAMAGFVLKVIFVLSILAIGVKGQNECYENGDCNGKQYCYNVSKLCANYTKCSLYNREEGTKPARQPSQCGNCILGYTAEKLVDGEAPAYCQKTTSNNANDHHVSEPSTIPYWAICLSVILLTFVGLGLTNAHYHFLSCASVMRCFRNVEQPVNERPSPPIPQNNITIEPSAPPLSQNNNDYSDAEESFPLSSTRECYGNTPVAFSKPVKAQAFRPPWYINGDENYNSGDTSEAAGTVRNLPETDEDTVPSPWRPADQATSNSVPNRPFLAINMEQQDNATNTALDNIRVCPSSSNSSEERLPGSGHQQNDASTSEDAESNNRRGQTHSQSVNIVVNANFCSRSSSGKDC